MPVSKLRDYQRVKAPPLQPPWEEPDMLSYVRGLGTEQLVALRDLISDLILSHEDEVLVEAAMKASEESLAAVWDNPEDASTDL